MSDQTKTITYHEYLQLLGLFVISRHHVQALKEIERAAAGIVGQPSDDNYFGHVSDTLWDEAPNVDDMLRNMGIVVDEKAPPREAGQ